MRNDEKTDACHRANRNDIQALREKGRNVYKKGEKKKGKKKKKKNYLSLARLGPHLLGGGRYTETHTHK